MVDLSDEDDVLNLQGVDWLGQKDQEDSDEEDEFSDDEDEDDIEDSDEGVLLNEKWERKKRTHGYGLGVSLQNAPRNLDSV